MIIKIFLIIPLNELNWNKYKKIKLGEDKQLARQLVFVGFKKGVFEL